MLVQNDLYYSFISKSCQITNTLIIWPELNVLSFQVSIVPEHLALIMILLDLQMGLLKNRLAFDFTFIQRYFPKALNKLRHCSL